MTKRILPNRMVEHIWAQQTQDWARSGNRNVSFDGERLFSYAALIGRFTKGIAGQTVILISDGSHHYMSPTTSGHISGAMSAARNHGIVFVVPSLGVRSGQPDHAENLAKLIERYQTSIAQMRRMRDDPQEWILDHATAQAISAVDYASAFGLDAPAIDCTADIASVIQFRAERDASLNTPERIAKRERDRNRREVLRTERATRQQELARLAATNALAAWRAGYASGYGLPYGAHTDADGGAYLRIVGDTLETSQGARVPLAHAIKAFRHIAACREAGVGWQRNGGTIRVGAFQIDQIMPDGSFRAGCHLINWPEIEAVARVAGVIS